jgi:hypothetical protein
MSIAVFMFSVSSYLDELDEEECPLLPISFIALRRILRIRIWSILLKVKKNVGGES